MRVDVSDEKVSTCRTSDPQPLWSHPWTKATEESPSTVSDQKSSRRWDKVISVTWPVFLTSSLNHQDQDYGRLLIVASVGKEGKPGPHPMRQSWDRVRQRPGQELLPSKITVNCLAPAITETELFEEMSESYIQEKERDPIRFARPRRWTWLPGSGPAVPWLSMIFDLTEEEPPTDGKPHPRGTLCPSGLHLKKSSFRESLECDEERFPNPPSGNLVAETEPVPAKQNLLIPGSRPFSSGLGYSDEEACPDPNGRRVPPTVPEIARELGVESGGHHRRMRPGIWTKDKDEVQEELSLLIPHAAVRSGLKPLTHGAETVSFNSSNETWAWMSWNRTHDNGLWISLEEQSTPARLFNFRLRLAARNPGCALTAGCPLDEIIDNRLIRSWWESRISGFRGSRNFSELVETGARSCPAKNWNFAKSLTTEFPIAKVADFLGPRPDFWENSFTERLTSAEIKNHADGGKLKSRGINLSVQRKIIALLGGNGTGKSTLLKTISGCPTDEGSIESTVKSWIRNSMKSSKPDWYRLHNPKSLIRQWR